jgi:hypothetical protein
MNALKESHHPRLKVWTWTDNRGFCVVKYRKVRAGGGLLTFRDRSPFMAKLLGRFGKPRPTNVKYVETVAEARKIVKEILGNQ